MAKLQFNNPKHVYVRWCSPLDTEHEDPEELGGIIHRFDYQTEAGSRFHKLALECKWTGFVTGEDDDIGIWVNTEADWYNWLTEVGLKLSNEWVTDATTDDDYAVETTLYVKWMLERSFAVEPDLAVALQKLAIDMLENMHLG